MSIQLTTISGFCKLRRLEHAFMAVLVITLLIAIFGIANASAQTQPMTFAASVASADGQLNTTLTWDAPGASGCTAAGHPSWTGEKTAAGTLALPTITLSGSYSLTLACTWPGNQTALLTWTPPLLNTDGTSLLDLAGYRIHYGQSSAALDQTIEADNASLTAFRVEGLAPATYYFAVRAVNSRGVSSALSNTASKTITGSESHSESIALTINPIPGEPSNLAVE